MYQTRAFLEGLTSFPVILCEEHSVGEVGWIVQDKNILVQHLCV